MFNSTVLEIAAGLIFVFLAVSLVTSAATEAIASMLRWRSHTLLTGVTQLLNDPGFNDLARKVYNHALISPRDPGNATRRADLKNWPAYIDAQQFSAALMDVVDLTRAAPQQIDAAIQAIGDPQLRELLAGAYARAAGDLKLVRKEVEDWFDNAMDRLSGAYKRRSQLVGFLIALLLVAGLDVDTLAIGRSLAIQPIAIRQLKQELDFPQAVTQLQGLDLSIGWTTRKWQELNRCDANCPGKAFRYLELLAGLLITATATLFGAPFWFDLLQKVTRLKGAGPSPAEKKADGAAAN